MVRVCCPRVLEAPIRQTPVFCRQIGIASAMERGICEPTGHHRVRKSRQVLRRKYPFRILEKTWWKCHPRQLENKTRGFLENQDVRPEIPSSSQMCGLCSTSLSYIGDVDLILFRIETFQITRVAFARCEVGIVKQPVANGWESGMHPVLHNVAKYWTLTFYCCGKKS